MLERLGAMAAAMLGRHTAGPVVGYTPRMGAGVSPRGRVFRNLWTAASGQRLQ